MPVLTLKHLRGAPARRALLLLLLLAAILPASARAADGRVEINATRALAGGVTPGDSPGYPVTLSLPGSYVLTGNLTVDANTTAIRIQATDVFLDLNGFGIAGPRAASGSGIGIDTTSGSDRVTVSDGFVTGTGSHGIRLRLDSRIERVVVFDCRGNGIIASSGSTVFESRAAENDLVGFSLSSDVGMAMNVATANGGEEVVGGTSLGDNRCDGNPCRSSSRRRFYLTTGSVNGANARTACAAGFHMASIWEIRSPEDLFYDGSLGGTRADSGEGPPAGPGAAGWARTGLQSATDAGGTFNDMPNCAAWTSSTSGHQGTRFNLTNSGNGPAAELGPWEILLQSCSYGTSVWCVED